MLSERIPANSKGSHGGSKKKLEKKNWCVLLSTLIRPKFKRTQHVIHVIKAGRKERGGRLYDWQWVYDITSVLRLLRIPWTAMRKNQSAVKEIGDCKKLATICRQSVLRYFGQLAHGEFNNLVKLVVVGNGENKCARGRSPTRCSDQIKATCANLKQLFPVSLRESVGGKLLVTMLIPILSAEGTTKMMIWYWPLSLV